MRKTALFIKDTKELANPQQPYQLWNQMDKIPKDIQLQKDVSMLQNKNSPFYTQLLFIRT